MAISSSIGRTPCFLLILLSCVIAYFAINQHFGTRHKTIDTKTSDKTVLDSSDCWFPSGKPSDNKHAGHQSKRQFLKERKLDQNTKIVLLYTGLFFHPWWWRNTEEDLHSYTRTRSCKIKNCFFTYEKSMFLIADAVVFHGVDINKPTCHRRLSEMRPANQRWILFMHESPLYTINLEPYNGLFNWTLTYMKKSDIYLPYFKYEKLATNRFKSIPTSFSNDEKLVQRDNDDDSRSSLVRRSHSLKNRNKLSNRPGQNIPTTLEHNFASGKTGKVVWVVSHCGLVRDSYALELEKYTDVAVYGDCGAKFKNNMGRCSDWATECQDSLQKYKFYLAFENCFCEDYITEKYWEKGLKYGLIPIVMGAFSASSHIIPGSYIDVNDFSSVELLAKRLLYLDRNDTAYNEYFKWRYEFRVASGGDCFCEVCKAVHAGDQMPRKVYHDIADFWSAKKNCDPFNWKLRDIKIQIAKSKSWLHVAR